MSNGIQKKSFKASIAHKDTSASIETDKVDAYDLGLITIILTSITIMVYLVTRKK